VTDPLLPRRDSVVLQINRLSSSWNKAAMKYYTEVWGLGIPHVRVLHTIGDRGPLAARDIVAVTMMNKGLVSRSLADLSRQNLVASTAESTDGRVLIWTLTATGEKLVASLRPVRNTRQRKLLEKFSPDELKTLNMLLDKLFSGAEALRKDEARLIAGRPAGGRVKDIYSEDDA
jgi:DNA-binding MarR family transcriptional regulator